MSRSGQVWPVMSVPSGCLPPRNGHYDRWFPILKAKQNRCRFMVIRMRNEALARKSALRQRHDEMKVGAAQRRLRRHIIVTDCLLLMRLLPLPRVSIAVTRWVRGCEPTFTGSQGVDPSLCTALQG